MTILALGAIAIEATLPYPDVPVDEGCGVFIDARRWQDSKENVIDVEWLMRFYRLPAGIRIDVVGVELARLVAYGPTADAWSEVRRRVGEHRCTNRPRRASLPNLMDRTRRFPL